MVTLMVEEWPQLPWNYSSRVQRLRLKRLELLCRNLTLAFRASSHGKLLSSIEYSTDKTLQLHLVVKDPSGLLQTKIEPKLSTKPSAFYHNQSLVISASPLLLNCNRDYTALLPPG